MGEEKKRGRPSEYNKETALKICTIIATSSTSLRTICNEEGMPDVTTVYRWIESNDEFRNLYARAKEDQADFLAEEMIEIADDATNDFMTVVKGDVSYEQENKEWTSRSKLRVDTRKWIASKLKPKKYGEQIKVDQTINHEPIIINRKDNDPNLPDTETT